MSSDSWKSPDALLYRSVFGLGLLLSVWMALRSQVLPDQVNQLRFGWYLLEHGILLPHGMPTSAGGFSPGALISLLTAGPLMLWWDFRAVALSMVFINVIAFLFLEKSIRPALSPRGRWLLLLFLWLAPWRMAFSSFIWPPNYAMPMGMIHLATAVYMRRKPVAWATFIHVLIIGFGAQLHSSAALLALLSITLFATRIIRVHWPAFAAAVLLTLLSLIPWMNAVIHDPALMPAGAGFPFRGLIFLFPLLRGVLYTLRMASLSLPSRFAAFDFTPALGSGVDALLSPPLTALAWISHLSVLLPVWGLVRLLRHARRRRPWRVNAETPLRPWLKAYLLAACAAALLSFAASPTTIMYWQVQVMTASMALALVLPLEALARTRHRKLFTRFIAVWTVATLLILGAMATAAPMFRRGGRRAAVAVLTAEEPLIDELGLREHCTISIDPKHQWKHPK